jgi:hypothetical protein
MWTKHLTIKKSCFAGRTSAQGFAWRSAQGMQLSLPTQAQVLGTADEVRAELKGAFPGPLMPYFDYTDYYMAGAGYD